MKQHRSLLNRGLSFVPTDTRIKNIRESCKLHVQQYHRKLKLSTFFRNKTPKGKPTPFRLPSTWEPAPADTLPIVLDLIEQDRRTLNKTNKEPEPKNLTKEEELALKELRNTHSIIIKPADKGSSVVIMDKTDYKQEALRQLNDPQYYRPLTDPIYPQTTQKITTILKKMQKEKFLSKTQMQYLLGSPPHRPRCFYLLPKIHKEPEKWTVPHKIPTGRPIVSDCGSESYGTAQLLDYLLNPLSNRHDSYIKDTQDFLQKITALHLEPNCMLFTADVESLYTNIETEKGLQAITECLQANPDPLRPDSDIMELLRINLECNDFCFNDKWYLQIKGTAMGKRFSPAYANIYMAKWEKDAFQKCNKLPQAYYRYLDDIWGIWNHSQAEFEDFINTLNQHHPSITIKPSTSQKEIHFLDTTTFKGPDFHLTGKLDHKLYVKPTDTHALLHRKSFHPKHTFTGIIKSQLLRYARGCSRETDKETATTTLFKALKHRSYTRRGLRKIRQNQNKRTRNPTEATERNQDQQVIPITGYFSHYTLKAHQQLKNNFQEKQQIHPQLQNLKIISAFKRNPSLQDLLVRSKFTANRRKGTDNTPGTETTIRSTKTNKRWPIQPKITHGTKNTIYLIWCTICQKQYIGETGNSLTTRLHAHTHNIRKNRKSETPIVQHFQQHGIENLRAKPIQHNPTWTQTERRKQERIWIHRIQCKFPDGMNMRMDA